MGFSDYYNQALDFLAGGSYSQNCVAISTSRDGAQILGHWGIAATIYASIKCLFD